MILGVDLGATNTKVVLLSDTDKIDVLESFPTDGEDGHDVVIQRVISRLAPLIESKGVRTVGVGTPGLFDAEGVVTLFTNLPGQWIGVRLQERLVDGPGTPVSLVNDARAFTLAEGTFGAGRGTKVMVGLTLGTGIGGGILIDGQLFEGASGFAGELSHQIVDPGGRLCGCGNLGCAEAAARADTLTSMTGRSTVEDVYEGFASNDASCVAAVEAAADALGRALANVIVVLGPDVIVVGGGVATAGGALVLDPIRAATERYTKLIPSELVAVRLAELGSSAGAIGAALAARSAEADH